LAVGFIDLRNTPADLARLDRFYEELFVPGFPDEDERESLETLRNNLTKVERGFYGRNAYHIILGLEDDRPVAACISDYLAESNCAAIEYILVAENRRGSGIGRAIHDYAVKVATADARAAGALQLNSIMIEVNDPYCAPPELDTIDAFSRVMMWHKWGYQRLVFPYQQPALSEEQSAIDYLLIAVKVVDVKLLEGFPSVLARQLVIDYLVWANRFDAFDDDPYFLAMSRYAKKHLLARLEPLDRYIGRTPPLAIDEIKEGRSPDFIQAMAVYRQAFPPGPTAITEERFRLRLSQRLQLGSKYHLWSLSEVEGQPASGITSFFSMPGVGFLAYLVLKAPLAGRGLARVALKRIEEAMFRDHSDITCCYVECEAGSKQEAIFKRLGFFDVGQAYEQPNLSDEDGEGVPLSLLRKPLGDRLLAEVPGAAQLEQELRTIMTVVYGPIDGAP
jgi:GNAT superfamily N-acetyltransferase